MQKYKGIKQWKYFNLLLLFNLFLLLTLLHNKPEKIKLDNK